MYDQLQFVREKQHAKAWATPNWPTTKQRIVDYRDNLTYKVVAFQFFWVGNRTKSTSLHRFPSDKMFIGHYAVGLAAKKFAPQASLGALMAAPILLDLLWPVFLLLGWEHVSIVPNGNPFLRLQFDYYPISHGLVAVIGWATLYASIYFGVTRYLEGTIAIWIGVVSHWVMDYVVHLPDLPLAAKSRLVGFGLWNHRWFTIVLEVALFAVAIWTYQRETRARDKIGLYAFLGFVALLLLAYGGAALGPPPPQSVKKLAGFALVTCLAIPWAWWFDSHREPTRPERK